MRTNISLLCSLLFISFISTAPAIAQKVALHHFSCGQLNFYTTNEEEGIKAGCIHVGVIGYLNSSQAAGTQALYRFKKGDGHLYTTSKDEGMKAGFFSEGVTGYINTAQTDGTKPLYRYSKEIADPKSKGKTKTVDHLYTTDENEGTKAGYKYEGIAGYISTSAN